METDREHSDAGSSAEDKDTPPRDEDVGSFAEGQELLPDDEDVGSFAEGDETLPRDEDVGSFAEGDETLPRDEDVGSFADSEEPRRRLIQASNGPSPSALATRWARERAPGFVIALGTCERTVSPGNVQLVGELRSGARHELDGVP